MKIPVCCWAVALSLAWGPTARGQTDIVSDQFSGNNLTAISGRTPDGANRPAGTWSTISGYYPGFDAIVDWSLGNPAPTATSGFNSLMWVPLVSAGSYIKPTHFQISADLFLGSFSTDTSTFRGVALGFFGGTGPGGGNGYAGHFGVNNFDGVWFDVYRGDLYLQTNTMNYLNYGNGGPGGGPIQPIATYDADTLGPFNPGQFYHLSYWVDTVTGTINNITLSTLGATQTVAGVYAGPGIFNDANTANAGLQFCSANFNNYASVDNFNVNGPFIAPPPPPNIIFEHFTGGNGAAVNGRTPDSTNRPAGTWSTASGYTSGNGALIDTAAGFPLPAATSGFNSEMWVPIGSAGSYAKPSAFRISADLRLGSFSPDSTSIRGIALGFYGAGGPNSPNAGHFGVSDFDGIWFNPGDGALYLQTNGMGWLGINQAGGLTPIATYDAATLGPLVQSKFYHLSYWVDTASGTISDITLSLGSATQTVPGVFGGADAFNDANSAYAGFQFSSANLGTSGSVDNFGVDAPAAANPLSISSITRAGNDIQLVWTTTGGNTNEVEASASPNSSGFAGISGPIVIPGSGAVTHSYTIVGGATNPTHFYRIRLVQ